jgi:hypothetical protein
MECEIPCEAPGCDWVILVDGEPLEGTRVLCFEHDDCTGSLDGTLPVAGEPDGRLELVP